VCKRGNVFSLPVLNRSTGLTIKFARCKHPVSTPFSLYALFLIAGFCLSII
jgi:hypothetical protein